MALAGLRAYLAYSLRKKMPQKKWFLFAFILGSIIPDVDLILTSIYSIFNKLFDGLLHIKDEIEWCRIIIEECIYFADFEDQLILKN